MKDTIKSIVLVGIVAIVLGAVKLAKISVKLLGIRVEKGGYICKSCKKTIINGQGVLIEGQEYFYCISCIRTGGYKRREEEYDELGRS